MIPIKTLQSKLPYNELPWKRFEDLCRDLTASKFSELIGIRDYLSQGHRQHGIDIRGFDPECQKYVYVQCKNVEKFGSSDLLNAIGLFEKGKFFSDSRKFIICVRSIVNEKFEEVIRETEMRFAIRDVIFEVWDEKVLNRVLREEPQVVYDFFGENYCKEFNGEERFKSIQIRPKPKEYPEIENFIPRRLKYFDKNKNEFIQRSFTEIFDDNVCYLLIKSDATIGKTIELKQIAYYYSAKELNKFFPILISLKNYVFETLDELLRHYFSEDWKKVNERQLLILLDGFDEIKSEERDSFLRKLGLFIESTPLAKVVISSRSNFITDSTLLPEFETALLPNFSDEDIENYAKMRIDIENQEMFFKYIKSNKIKNWISSPFNLSYFIELFNNDSENLPKTRVGLLNQVINFKLDKDFEKYRIEPISQIAFRTTLSKLAFSFNLFGVNSVSITDLVTVFSDIDIEIIRKLSVVKIEDNSVFFEHNVIHEFLSAKMLSEKPYDEILKAISFKPDFQKIKPKWYNTIGILIELLGSNHSLLSNLIGFISKMAPEILKGVEYSFIPLNLRLEAFKIIIEDPNRPYQRDSFYTEEFAVFSGINENENVLEYLLVAINSKNEVNNELIYCLRYKDKNTLWGFEQEIIESLGTKICEGNETTQQISVEVLTRLALFDDSITRALIETSKQTQNFGLIDVIFKYINKAGLTEKYLTLYFEAFQKFREYENNPITVSGYGDHLLIGLESVISRNSLIELLDFLTVNIDNIYEHNSIIQHRIYGRDTFFKTLKKNLKNAYLKGDDELLEKLLLFTEKSNRKGRGNEIEIIYGFFFETDTNERFFWRIWLENSQKSRIELETLGYLADDGILEKIESDFLNSKIPKSEVWDLIHLLSWANQHTLSEKFRERVNVISDNYFAYKNRPNWDEINKLRKERDFELILDKGQFKEKVLDFFEYYKKDELTHSEIFDYKREWLQGDNNVTGYFLNDFFVNKIDRETYKISREVIENWFLNDENWEWYRIDFLQSNLDSELINSSLISEVIHQWFFSNIDKTNFYTAIKDTRENEFTTRYLESSISKFFRAFDLSISEEKQLEMLAFDISHGDMPSKDKKYISIIQKVINNLGVEKVRNRLLENLKSKELSINVLHAHIHWCKKLMIVESAVFIKEQIVKNHKRKTHRIENFLDTYVFLNGDLRDLNFIFNDFDPEVEFDWQLLRKMAEQRFFKKRIWDLLNSLLEQNKDSEIKIKSAHILLEFGYLEGLKLFVDWFKLMEKLPETHNKLLPIETLPKKEAIPILIDWLQSVLTKEIGEVRFSDPIGYVFSNIKSFKISSELEFVELKQELSNLENKPTLDSNLHALRRNIINFEKEFYLERVDYQKFNEISLELNSLFIS